MGVEFGRVLADMNMGKARVEAFDSLRRRLNDDEVGGIVAAILQSEHWEPHLQDLDSIRRAASQCHAASRKDRWSSGVNMLLPAMLVMAATVILILGPSFLNYFVFDSRHSGLDTNAPPWEREDAARWKLSPDA
ncbi:MAG: hypothetical protein R3B96_15865 [Pirellulaceae bacterium]